MTIKGMAGITKNAAVLALNPLSHTCHNTIVQLLCAQATQVHAIIG